MPELPEVEITRRGFADALRGARVTGVRLGKPLRWPLGIAPQALVGRTVGDTTRRGKYLWLALPGPGAASEGLLLHLGMSGSLALLAMPGPPAAHDHFDLVTNAGTLRLTDPRRFGAVLWSAAIDAGRAGRLLGRLGLEPFDPAFTGHALWCALKSRRVGVKQALLGGEVVVGAGNIYACEALFAAGIDPRTRSHRLSRPRCERLAQALRATLSRALELGGSSLRDFRDVHGARGAFQQQTGVYARAGQACPRCDTEVRRIVQAQRSTYFCPVCQHR